MMMMKKKKMRMIIMIWFHVWSFRCWGLAFQSWCSRALGRGFMYLSWFALDIEFVDGRTALVWKP